MKKLLGLLGAIQLVVVPVMSVVSCESNADYNTFKSWINAKQSFLLYIGADDCEVCQSLDKLLGMTINGQTGEKVLRDKLNNTAKVYNSYLATTSNTEASLQDVGWGKMKSIEFHQFKYDKYDNIWGENKSMKNIRDYLAKNYIDIVKKENPSEWAEVYKSLYKSDSDDVLKVMRNLITTNHGTPILLLFRNGKYVAQFNGFNYTNKNFDDFNQITDEILTSLKNDSLTDDLVADGLKQLTGSSDNSDSGDDSSTKSVSTNQNLTFNYDNINFEKYL